MFIIESPGASDITTGDKTGEHLQALLHLLRIPAERHSINKASLLVEKLKLASEYPVVHIAAHGRDGAIGFTDGSLLTKDELEAAVLPHCNGKIVSLDFCDSSDFRPSEALSSALSWMTNGKMGPPACVVTMFGKVKFADSLLSWGVFYRHLFKLQGERSTTNYPPQREIYESLKRAKGADLHPMCAAFWYSKYQKFADISPWKDGKTNIDRMAAGTAPK